MKQAFILGCSHALGAEMHLEPGVDLSQCHSVDHYQTHNSYPALIAQKLGYSIQNHAIAGGSNDAMFRIFCEQVNSISTTDLVIACWTGLNRTELLYTRHQRWLPLPAGETLTNCVDPNPWVLQGQPTPDVVPEHVHYEDYGRRWLIYQGNEQTGHHNKVKNILALNSVAHSRGISVLNIDSFWPTRSRDPKQNMLAHVKWGAADTDFWRFAKEHNFPHTKWGHYFRPAHLAFADHVMSGLGALNLNTA
jgi:hypothetical protein